MIYVKKKKKILWLDDEIWYLSIFLDYFINHPEIEIEGVSTVDSAIFKLQNDSYDLIITDWLVDDKDNESHHITRIRNGDFDLANNNSKISSLPIIIFSLIGGSLENAANEYMVEFYGRNVFIIGKQDVTLEDLELLIKRTLSIG